MLQNITFTITALIAGITLALSGFALAPIAHAQMTEAELDAEISRLTALIEQLTGQLNVGGSIGTTVPASVCPYVWQRDLGQGARGADVMRLQQFLNASADTRLAVSGAGSPGMETQYYGPITANAVSRFQSKYRTEILAPLGLVNPTGYFGAMSRTKANDLCVTPTPIPTPDDDANDDANDDEDDDEDFELRGEGTLDVFEIDDEEDEVEEGEEDVPVATVTLEADHGDIELTRMDIALVADAGNDEDEPWEVFESVSLWMDGDRIAEFDDADDEDEYLDEDDGTIRFSRLSIILEENEEVEITIAVSVQNGVDGAGSAAEWDLSVEEVRYFDADGVATDEDNVDEMGDAITFDIVEEGEGDDLDMRASSEDPDEGTLILDEDDNEDHAIFAFELDADDSDGDVELNELAIDVEISSTTGDIDAIVDDFYVEIDGETFDAESYTATSTVHLVFDIDGDIVIDAGDAVTVVLFAEFENMESDSLYQGVTIMASADRDDVDAEGADDINVGGSDQTGEEHTLRSVGLFAEDEPDTDADADEGIGTYTFEFELTAIEEDMFISTSSGSASDGEGFDWTVVGGAATTNATVQTDADIVSGFYRVRAGQAETFTVVVTVDPTSSGSYYVRLDDVNYNIGTAAAADTTYVFTPATDWDTRAVSIAG